MAGLKKDVILKVAMLVLLLLLAALSAQPDHRTNLLKLLTFKNHESDKSLKSKNPGCCERCYCLVEDPDKCICLDTFRSYSRCQACKNCLCTNRFSLDCWCADVLNSCSSPCSHSLRTAAAASLEIKQFISS